MGSLIIALIALAVYSSEVHCDTLPTKTAKSEDTVLLEKNNSQAAIDEGSFWKNFNLSRRKLEEARNLDSINSEQEDKRKGRFLSTLSFLTGLSFGGLATAASSTVKSFAKMPQVFSVNLGSSKTSPYFAAYYSQYPYAPLLPYPFFYPGPLGPLGPLGIAPMIDAVKPQTSQNDVTPQVINLFDNRPVDLAENNEDYTDAEKSGGNGADDRIKLRTSVDRNAEEKGTTRECKEGQRKQGKGTAREREYQVTAADLQTTLNFRAPNQTVSGNTTTIKPPGNTTPNHHHHHHHHHHQYPYYSGYYGGHPQDIHHVEITTTQPYSQIHAGYHVPYEQPVNFYHDEKYNVYPGFNPSYSAPYSPDPTHEYADFNRLYPSGYQPPNISDGFKPVK